MSNSFEFALIDTALYTVNNNYYSRYAPDSFLYFDACSLILKLFYESRKMKKQNMYLLFCLQYYNIDPKLSISKR